MWCKSKGLGGQALVLQERLPLGDKETELHHGRVLARQEASAWVPRRLPSPATPVARQGSSLSHRSRLQVLGATQIAVP